MRENLFRLSMGDATAYLVFYLIIPISITWYGLRALPSNLPALPEFSAPVALSATIGLSDTTKFSATAVAYCYLSIFISGLNGIYDGANRREKAATKKTQKFLSYVLVM